MFCESILNVRFRYVVVVVVDGRVEEEAGDAG